MKTEIKNAIQELDEAIRTGDGLWHSAKVGSSKKIEVLERAVHVELSKTEDWVEVRIKVNSKGTWKDTDAALEEIFSPE